MKRSYILFSVAFMGLGLIWACGSADDSRHQGGGVLQAPSDTEDELMGRDAYDAALLVKLPQVAPAESPALHNVFELSDHIISGSEPHGETAFRLLEERGVKTIISVDGKIPDVEMARRHGIRYVHIPIEYKGISDDEILRLAKTFRELEPPFYVHCFHGRHRGPAAAAIGRLVKDGVSRAQALAEMRQWSGTSSKYRGLYDTIARASIPGAEVTGAFRYDFPSAVRVEGIRQSMVVIPRAFDHLKALKKNRWAADPRHPDIDALNESLKLAEAFAAAEASADTAGRPDDFRAWMKSSVKESAALVELLRRVEQGDGRAAVDADAAFGRMKKLCASCHGIYRNQ
ncbi:MAG TPA: hypothetical protein ENK43_07355 [Planctomycetes bacterium]|nr:hypothetical protein [Planctomycetota bacterium]